MSKPANEAATFDGLSTKETLNSAKPCCRSRASEENPERRRIDAGTISAFTGLKRGMLEVWDGEDGK